MTDDHRMDISADQIGCSIRWSIAALMALSILSVTTVASADTPAIIADKIHLLGTWAIDCSKLSAPTNVRHSFYATSDGGVHFSQDSGLAEKPIGATVERIVALTPTTVSMRLRKDDLMQRRTDDLMWKRIDSRVYELVVEIDGDRSIVLQSVLDTGEVMVKDGRLVGVGTASPVRERCRGAAPRAQ